MDSFELYGLVWNRSKDTTDTYVSVMDKFTATVRNVDFIWTWVVSVEDKIIATDEPDNHPLTMKQAMFGAQRAIQKAMIENKE